MNEHSTIAADIGSSHITATQMNADGKRLVGSSLVRCQVNAMGTVQEVIYTWAQCIQQAAQHAAISKISLAMPEPFDYEKSICFIQDQSKYAQLYKLNVKELLAN